MYSFLAASIVVNGRNVATEEKWVDFGKTLFSFCSSFEPSSTPAKQTVSSPLLFSCSVQLSAHFSFGLSRLNLLSCILASKFASGSAFPTKREHTLMFGVLAAHRDPISSFVFW